MTKLSEEAVGRAWDAARAKHAPPWEDFGPRTRAALVATCEALLPQWIQCSERLPELDACCDVDFYVQAFHPRWGVRAGWRDGEHVRGDWPGDEYATHWAPMLEAPSVAKEQAL